MGSSSKKKQAQRSRRAQRQRQHKEGIGDGVDAGRDAGSEGGDLEELVCGGEALLAAGERARGAQLLLAAARAVLSMGAPKKAHDGSEADDMNGVNGGAENDGEGDDSEEIEERVGFALAEAGFPEQALEVLERAAAFRPATGHEKFMYMSQMMEGEAALLMAMRGMRILEAAVHDMEKRPAAAEVDARLRRKRADLCSAICAMSEIHLDRTAFDDGGDAEYGERDEAVVEQLRRACQLDPKSPEPLQVLASLRLSMGMHDEARELLMESMSKWSIDSSKGDRDAGGMDVDGEDEDGDAADADADDERDVLSIEFRFTTANLLLELEEEEEAIEVLEELLEEENNHRCHIIIDHAHPLRKQVKRSKV